MGLFKLLSYFKLINTQEVFIKFKNKKFVIAAIVTWCFIFIIEFNVNYKNHANDVNKSLNQVISIIEDKNDRYTDLLDYASAFFTKSPTENLYRTLFEKNYKYNSDQKVYEVAKSELTLTGALTSLTALNKPEDKQNVLRAYELTPLFIQAKKLFPKSPWIYFTSEKFIYIYPYVDSSEFKFTKEIVEMEFFQRNLPQNNKEKSVIWTNPYFDLAGQGMMITKSKPIYISNDFAGTISIDIKISDISNLINFSQFTHGRLLIVNQLGNLITSNQKELNHKKEVIQIYKTDELLQFERNLMRFNNYKKILFFQKSTKNNFIVTFEVSFIYFLLLVLGSQYISLFVFVFGFFIIIWWNREERINLRIEADSIQKNKLISLAEMSGGIAHEINNPLTVILGRASQSLRKMQSEDCPKEEVKNNLEKIVFSAERIGKIITTLKNFSRSDSNQQMQTVTLEKIISETLLLCENRIHNDSAEIEIETVPSVEIKCHAYQVIQILINLINNSFDAVSNSEEKWIKISFETKQNIIEIKVSDSGPGVEKQHLNKLFEPFFTTKPINYGTGLGLSISKKIALNHRGDLYYDSGHTHTRFILKLPIALH